MEKNRKPSAPWVPQQRPTKPQESDATTAVTVATCRRNAGQNLEVDVDEATVAGDRAAAEDSEVTTPG